MHPSQVSAQRLYILHVRTLFWKKSSLPAHHPLWRHWGIRSSVGHDRAWRAVPGRPLCIKRLAISTPCPTLVQLVVALEMKPVYAYIGFLKMNNKDKSGLICAIEGRLFQLIQEFAASTSWTPTTRRIWCTNCWGFQCLRTQWGWRMEPYQLYDCQHLQVRVMISYLNDNWYRAETGRWGSGGYQHFMVSH